MASIRHTVVLVVSGASGIIFAFVVVIWLAYVVPLMLRRYDEASKTSSLGSFTSLGRVISRPKKTVAAAESQGSVEGSTSRPAEPTEPVKTSESVLAPAAQPVPAVDRPAARLAAKRRRRVLITLLTSLVVVAGVSAFGVIGWVWAAIPAVVIVAWLVTCRIQVRGERGIGRATGRSAGRGVRRGVDKSSSAGAMGATAADEEETVVLSGQFEDVDPGRKHVMQQTALEADALDEQLVIAVPSVATTGEAVWDPLPVTLPTYVTKPRAGRTVRTIDFGQAGTWTSGHIEGEDVTLPGQRSPAEQDGESRKAVGH